MQGLDKAQRAYDRMIPEDDYCEDRPLNDNDVEFFIKDFANSEGDAQMWIQNLGIDITCMYAADVLRNLCKSWQKNPLAVYDVAGVEFWREMKALAIEAIEY